jgi:hypothetical protein
MKKLAVFAVSLLTAGASFAGTIGENFEQSGFALSAYGYYYNEPESDWSNINIAPGVRFYPKQNVSINTSIRYQSYGFEGDKTQDFYVNAGAAYSFGYDVLAEKGLVHSAGVYGTRATYSDSPDYVSFSITPYYRADYFLTDRISVYGDFELFSLNLSTGADDLINTYFEVTTGISVHFPNSFRDWSKVLK